MTDLTNITTPFGLLDLETQEALRAWEYGIEVYETDSGWRVSSLPFRFFGGLAYRARPAPLVPDSINWEHVAPEWKWMARDDGSDLSYLYPHKPYRKEYGWGASDCASVYLFASYRRGTVAWQDSLVARPA